jgi:phosphoserine phosphatase
MCVILDSSESKIDSDLNRMESDGMAEQPVLGVVVQGQYMAARAREWTSRQSGEKGVTNEILLALEEGGEPVAVDADEKLIRQARMSFKLGQIVRIRCSIGQMSRVTGLEFI